LRPEVEFRASRIGHRLRFHQPTLPLESSPEGGARGCHKEIDHCHRNGSLFDQLTDPEPNIAALLVEAEHETADDCQAVPLDVTHGFRQGALQVLRLTCSGQCLHVGCFKPYENISEVCRGHKVDKLRILSKVNGYLRRIPEGFTMVPVPFRHGLEDFTGIAGIPNEIVVGNENMARVACSTDGFEFGYHLSGGLVARRPAEQLYDIAEFALERATS